MGRTQLSAKLRIVNPASLALTLLLLSAAATQVFEYGFDGDLGAIQTALVGFDHGLVVFGNSKQSFGPFGQSFDSFVEPLNMFPQLKSAIVQAP